MDALLLLIGGAGLSAAVWRWQHRRGIALLRARFDGDAQVALHVAVHLANTERRPLATADVVRGLAQDERFARAIRTLGGDPDRALANVPLDPDGARVVAIAAGLAHRRPATIADLWRAAMPRVATAVGLDATALLFVLVHGEREPAPPAAAADHDVVLRNDDYTPFELVHHILREVFEVSEAQAIEIARQTHERGRATVGRYPTELARDRVETARTRARHHMYPLWIGLE